MGRKLDELSVFSGDPPFMSHHCVIFYITGELMMMTTVPILSTNV